MSAVRLALTAAGSGSTGNNASLIGGLNPTGGHITFAASSDLIGQFPINGATVNLPSSSPMLSSVGGGTTLASSGYVSGIDQYGADQLTFAFSQGEYTASGATPQTYIQDQFGSTAMFLQPYAASQAVYYTINSQNNMFFMSAQMLETTNYASSFNNLYTGAGSFVGSVPFSLPSVFSTATTINDPTGSATLGQGSDALTGALTTGLTQVASSGIVTSVGSNAGVITVAGDGSPIGQSSSSIASHSAAELGSAGESGSVRSTASSSPHTAPPESAGAETAADGSASGHGQAAASQNSLPATLPHNPSFVAETLSLNNYASDPFAHYSQSQLDGQHAQNATVAAANIIPEFSQAAAETGGDSVGFSDHLAYPHGQQAGQPVDAHVDPFNHSMQHAAETGGHLA